MQGVGALLARHRAKKKLTQEQAAKELGISRYTLSQYENDKKPIKITVYVQMALLYEFDPLEDGIVRDSATFEMDGGTYGIFKIHLAYVVKNEYKKMISFSLPGGDLSDEYFEKKFDKMLSQKVERYKNIPGFRGIEEEYKNDKNKSVMKFIKTKRFE